MKKMELLAPAGNLDAFFAAISNGADAVYLGGTNFSARAYADNFQDDELKTAIHYAHIRNRKVFITINTLIADSELQAVKQYIEKVYLFGVDGIIVQDFGILNYLIENFSDLKIIASTQMTISDLNGVKFLEALGVDRIVMARETNIDEIKNIKSTSSVEIEVFGHGALCVCYSGQCIMSSLIGGRSGNRGTCAQPCRKQYILYNESLNIDETRKSYLLSMKDLNVLPFLSEVINSGVDSLKIEGRMKVGEYVANIVSNYRKAIDAYYNKENIDLENLNLNNFKTFNRGFTKGHLLGEDPKVMGSHIRPNNQGYLLGKITNTDFHGYIEIDIKGSLKQEDIIMITSDNDIVYKVVRLFDRKLKLINSISNDKGYLQIREKIRTGDKVYKVLDYEFEKKLKSTYPLDNYKLPLKMEVQARKGLPFLLILIDGNYRIEALSHVNVEQALSSPVSKDKLHELLNKIHDTPYYLENILFDIDDDIFISLKVINEVRRKALNDLYELKQLKRTTPNYNNESIKLNSSNEKGIAVKVRTKQQYEIVKELGIETIYFDEGLLAKNYGEIDDGKIGDYSLNTFNALSVYQLMKNNLKRVTLSLELSILQLKELYENFVSNYNFNPELEYVIYSRPEVMVSKFCVLKSQGLCGKCKKNKYYLKDNYGSFPIINDENCHMHILHNKVINKIDELDKVIPYVNFIRLELFDEDSATINELINKCKEAIK